MFREIIGQYNDHLLMHGCSDVHNTREGCETTFLLEVAVALANIIVTLRVA